jgi:hypothetical protein
MNWNGIASLFIACIELILVINMLIFTGKNKLNITAIVITTILFIYQLFEFLMCHFGFASPFLAYLAFVDISFLPPLTLYYILNMLNSSYRKFSTYLFIPPVLFTIGYAFMIPEFKVASCTVIYAAYNYPLGTLYGIFYYLPLLISMLLLFSFINKNKTGKDAVAAKVLFSGLVTVFLPVLSAFILSAFGLNLLLSAIESIMCKFALVIAFCFAFVSIYRGKQKPIKQI